jgi:predicted small secreted protein
MKKLFVLFCVAVALTGCSTVAGVGKDISSAAEWTKEKMK